MIVGIFEMINIGATVAIIKLMLGFCGSCITLSSYIMAPSVTLSVETEVEVVVVYIGSASIGIREKSKQINGIINPNHLFCLFDKNI